MHINAQDLTGIRSRKHGYLDFCSYGQSLADGQKAIQYLQAELLAEREGDQTSYRLYRTPTVAIVQQVDVESQKASHHAYFQINLSAEDLAIHCGSAGPIILPSGDCIRVHSAQLGSGSLRLLSQYGNRLLPKWSAQPDLTLPDDIKDWEGIILREFAGPHLHSHVSYKVSDNPLSLADALSSCGEKFTTEEEFLVTRTSKKEKRYWVQHTNGKNSAYHTDDIACARRLAGEERQIIDAAMKLKGRTFENSSTCYQVGGSIMFNRSDPDREDRWPLTDSYIEKGVIHFKDRMTDEIVYTEPTRELRDQKRITPPPPPLDTEIEVEGLDMV